MVTDYRGNPAYSTMISKLCAFSPRSEFILKVLQHELTLKGGQQVMILAHNKNVLTYLYKAIEHRHLASVGYYVGGMKEADLKATESKQIVIATYAMAAEALDIKTLTTLILATPKTDITQAIGRILRVKHERPLVIDIVDQHPIFLQQYAKRRKFYKSNKYVVTEMRSPLYLAKIVDCKDDIVAVDPDDTEESDSSSSSSSDIKPKRKNISGELNSKGKCLIACSV
jgi:superfamily II DNA or RNA helicase